MASNGINPTLKICQICLAAGCIPMQKPFREADPEKRLPGIPFKNLYTKNEGQSKADAVGPGGVRGGAGGKGAGGRDKLG